MKESVGLVGGGISGLSAAYFALQKGFSVDLFESTDRLGGLAASFDFDGLNIERYYHFICRGDHKLIEFSNRLGIGDQIHFQKTKTAFFYDGKYYSFGTPFDLLKFSPIPVLSRLKFGLNFIRSKYAKEWERLDEISAKDWLYERIGERAYEVIWDPLLRVKFGDYNDEISAAWVWHRIHRVASSRKGLLSREKMGYFLNGSQTLFARLENNIKEMGGSIHLNSNIRKITKGNGRLCLTVESGKQFDFDRLILAVPLPIASELIKELDRDYAGRLSSFDFIGVTCGIFRLKINVTDAFWLNINDPRIAANGLVEYTNLNPLKDRSHDKIVYIPFYVPLESKWFSMSEEQMRHELFGILKIINPDLTEDAIAGFRAFKSAHAQAICTVGFKDRVPSVKTPIKNLFLLDSTQLYPSDRVLSALIELAEKTVNAYF